MKQFFKKYFAWILFPFYNVWFYCTYWEGEWRFFFGKLIGFPFLLLWTPFSFLFLLIKFQIWCEPIETMRDNAELIVENTHTKKMILKYVGFWD